MYLFTLNSILFRGYFQMKLGLGVKSYQLPVKGYFPPQSDVSMYFENFWSCMCTHFKHKCHPPTPHKIKTNLQKIEFGSSNSQYHSHFHLDIFLTVTHAYDLKNVNIVLCK